MPNWCNVTLVVTAESETARESLREFEKRATPIESVSPEALQQLGEYVRLEKKAPATADFTIENFVPSKQALLWQGEHKRSEGRLAYLLRLAWIPSNLLKAVEEMSAEKGEQITWASSVVEGRKFPKGMLDVFFLEMGHISKMYPELKFEINYDDYQAGFEGEKVFRNGHQRQISLNENWDPWEPTSDTKGLNDPEQR